MKQPYSSSRDETGFTLIEVVVAMLVASVVIAALTVAMVNNNSSSVSNQRQVQLLSLLQDRVEYVRQIVSQYGFPALALSSNPSRESDSALPASPTDPNDFITPYVSGFTTSALGTAENYLIEKNYDNTSEGTIDGSAAYGEELEVDPANGQLPPLNYVDLANGSTYASASSVPTGDPYAAVYTYVTRATAGINPSLSSCSATLGTGSTADDARRVIVAARLYQPRSDNVGSKTPQYTTTMVYNPQPSNQCQAQTGLLLGPGVL